VKNFSPTFLCVGLVVSAVRAQAEHSGNEQFLAGKSLGGSLDRYLSACIGLGLPYFCYSRRDSSELGGLGAA
jgi:hypothetical protein